METDVLGWALFILTFLSWLSRELWLYRERKRRAEEEASKMLNEKKKFLNEMISKTKDTNLKQELTAQLDDVNAALWGLYTERLRRVLREAKLPAEEELVAGGRSLLQPHQITRLEEVVAQVKSLPLPLSTEDLLVLGNAYYYMGQYQDAKSIYDKILKLNPDDAQTLDNRGVTYDELGKYDKALADFNRSLELRPDHPATLNNRGNTYHKLGRYDYALADYNRSLELRPDDPDTLNNRGVTYNKLGKYDKALADFKRALELRPDHPDILMNRGIAYGSSGRYDDALADFNRFLKFRPDHPDALYNRGLIYSVLGRRDDALADFKRALELRPDHPTMYDLACLFSRWGRTDDALTYLEKAIDKDKRYREMAKTDEGFDNIRDDPRFKKLMESD